MEIILNDYSNDTELKNRIVSAFKTKTPIDRFFERFGQNDGGYVCIQDFSKDDYLISMGVGNDIYFEKSISDLFFGVDLYDNSVDAIPVELENHNFFKETIGENSKHIFDRVPKDKDLVLKIDVEGGEWAFFQSLTHEEINQFRQIIVEIHWMVDTEWISYPECPIHIIEKINKTHQLVAKHPNNYSEVVYIDGINVPQVLELTYLRKSSYNFTDEEDSANHLFVKNNPDKPEIVDYL